MRSTFKQLTPRTDTALARVLGVTRAALRDWRRDFPMSAPATRDVAEWENFIAANALGSRSTGRQLTPRGTAAALVDLLMHAEVALGRAQLLVDARMPAHADRFLAARRRVAEILTPLFGIR